MENLKSEKLYIRVFNEIRKYIVTNNLAAGDKLPTEHEMCDMLGVSRNVLREAIKALEIIGLIKSVPSKGIVLQEFNMDFLFQHMFYYLVVEKDELIKEIMEIRKILELGYMQEAFHAITQTEVGQMRALVDEMFAKAAQDLMYGQEDQEFHALLFKNISNRTLESIFTAAWNVDANFNVMVKKLHLEKFAIKHLRIVEALEARDYNAFEQSMHDHFSKDTYFISV